MYLVAQVATEPLSDFVVDRRRADEEKPLMAKRLPSQDVSLVDDLGKDALVDVLPVEASGRLLRIRYALEIGRSLP
jgi:hypothetical protein